MRSLPWWESHWGLPSRLIDRLLAVSSIPMVTLQQFLKMIELDHFQQSAQSRLLLIEILTPPFLSPAPSSARDLNGGCWKICWLIEWVFLWGQHWEFCLRRQAAIQVCLWGYEWRQYDLLVWKGMLLSSDKYRGSQAFLRCYGEKQKLLLQWAGSKQRWLQRTFLALSCELSISYELWSITPFLLWGLAFLQLVT